MPLKFWDDAFSTVVYLINRLPTPILDWISPMEYLLKQKPNYSFLKTFGCLCFPCLRPYNDHKFQPRSTPSIFIGYSNVHKGYKCLSFTCRLYISRHVLFNETSFPFKTKFNLNSHPDSPSTFVNTFLPILYNQPQASNYSPSSTPSLSFSHVPNTSPINQPLSSSSSSPHLSPDPISTYIPPSINPITPHTSSPDHSLPYQSNSTVTPSTSPTPMVTIPHTVHHENPHNTHTMITRAKNGIFKPKGYLTDYKQVEPTLAKEALKHNHWRKVMEEEYSTLMKNGT